MTEVLHTSPSVTGAVMQLRVASIGRICGGGASHEAGAGAQSFAEEEELVEQAARARRVRAKG